jgi:prophage tail gpP-like protein
MASDVQVYVNGQIYTGWEQVEIQSNLEQASGGFSLTVSNLEPWPIAPGDECKVAIDGESVVVGYVDKVDTGFDAYSHTFTIAGRDKTADLVDCEVANGTGELAGQTLKQIAEFIAGPFGVKVVADADTGGAFPKFSIQPGDTAYSTIERAARMQGVLVTTDGNGNLLLTKPKSDRAPVALVAGENVISASFSADDSGRYSQYIVKGQRPAANDNDDDSGDGDGLFGSASSSSATSAPEKVTSAVVIDTGTKRYRPRIIMAEGAVTAANATQRAQWQRTVDEARARRVSVVVQGWKMTPGGKIWRKNTLVPCRIPFFKLNDDMLIAGVRFSRSSAGTITTLDLTKPDGYAVEPVIPERAKKKKKAKDGSGDVDALFGSGKAA